MTIVGKILVFIVLVFSIVVGALNIFNYVTRFHYAQALKEERQYRQIEKGETQAYKAQVAEERTEKDARVAQVMDALKKVQADLDAQQLVVKDLKDKLDLEKQTTLRANALVELQKSEIQRRQEDVETTRKSYKEEMAKNLELVKVNNLLKERSTADSILATATLKRNRELDNQLQEMARDLARMRANAGPATPIARNGKNPPVENVEGLVSTADRDGLVKITLGTDAGLVRGHTMEVFRINPNNPSLSKYLGTIRIIDVNAHEAVGQPMDKMAAPVQKGDNVASRILGG